MIIKKGVTMKKTKIAIIIMSILALGFALNIVSKVDHDMKIIDEWESKFEEGIENLEKISYLEDEENLESGIKALMSLNYISVNDEMCLIGAESDMLDYKVNLIRNNRYGDVEADLVMRKMQLGKIFNFRTTYIPVRLENVEYIDMPIPLECPAVHRGFGEQKYTETYNLKDLEKLYSKLNTVNSHSDEDELLDAYLACIGEEFKGDDEAGSCVLNESDIWDFYNDIKKVRKQVKEFVELLEENKQYDLVKFKITTDKYRVFIGNRKYITSEVPTSFKFCEIHGKNGSEVMEIIDEY